MRRRKPDLQNDMSLQIGRLMTQTGENSAKLIATTVAAWLEMPP